jgi:hypothetical protein
MHCRNALGNAVRLLRSKARLSVVFMVVGLRALRQRKVELGYQWLIRGKKWSSWHALFLERLVVVSVLLV